MISLRKGNRTYQRSISLYSLSYEANGMCRMSLKPSWNFFVTLSVFFDCVLLFLAEAGIEAVLDHRLLLALIIAYWRGLVDLLEGGPSIIGYEDGRFMVYQLFFNTLDLAPAVSMLALMFLWLLEAWIAWKKGWFMELAFFQLLDEFLMFCHFRCNVVLSDIVASHIHCSSICFFAVETLSLWGEDCIGMVLGYSF